MIALLLTEALGRDWVVGQDTADLPAALAAAADGDVVRLNGVEHRGPVEITRAVAVVGPGTIRSTGEGTTVRLLAPNAALRGVTVLGAGSDMEAQDACVYTGPHAGGGTIAENDLRDCLFGVWIDRTDGLAVVDNRVSGRKDLTNVDRGNGIHTHDAARLDISRNAVTDVRDGIYVAATEDSVIADNELSDQRYGIHYMYSYRNRISGNRAQRDGSGIALMSSKELDVFGNITTDNVDHGLLLREIDDTRVHGNVAHGNGIGMFVYLANRCEIFENELRGNQIGVKLWAGSEGTTYWDNDLLHNARQVLYSGAVDQAWGTADAGNHFSDYLGWDQDRDGRGDRPYQVDATTAHLLHRYPAAVLLLTSPAVELIRAVQSRLPVFHLPTVTDPRPNMAPHGRSS